MKLLVATIQSDRLEALQQTLKEPEAYILHTSTIDDVRESLPASYRGVTYRKPRPRLRVEIVVMNDLAVQDAVDAISNATCSPNRDGVSNGSIFVMPIEDWIRIPSHRPRPVPQVEEAEYATSEAS